MSGERSSLLPASFALVAFLVASVISLWKLAELGPQPLIVIPAICFPVAVIAWLTFIIRRLRTAGE